MDAAAPLVANRLRLGRHLFDTSARALVMGICNRTPDSFFDKGEHFAFDRFLARIEAIVSEGADVIDVGGVKAGPGPAVSESEELDRVVPAIVEIRKRFELCISVDTWRASVAREAFAAGAVLGNDISGFADDRYLAEAAAAGASVVATHIRLQPRVPDPDPRYENLVGEVEAFLVARARQAEAAGISADGVILDAGLDLGKTAAQSLELLRASDRLAGLGYPLLLSASNKRFLGDVLGLEVTARRDASLAAAAFGIARGCRILRVHDVAATVKVRDVLEAVLRVEVAAGAPDPTRSPTCGVDRERPAAPRQGP
ncbi:MAG: dihydropteroate synthase [Acidimicrobiales bacterium]